MGVAVTYVAYLVISVALTVLVGSALSRSGRVFLLDVFGGQAAPAEAVNRLLVTGFYLLNLGFVTLTMRMSGEIGGPRQAIQVLSGKIGEVLLVLGALHLANIVFFTRLRRRVQAQAAQQPPGGGRPGRGAPDRGAPDRGAADHEAADHEAPDHRAADHEAPDHGAPDRRAPDHEAADHEAAGSARGLWRPRPRQALH
jgi:hypothetical protein